MLGIAAKARGDVFTLDRRIDAVANVGISVRMRAM